MTGGSETMICLAGLAAFLGHLYPVFLKFSGGKGVATAVGVYLAFAPLALAFGAVVFFLTILFSRYVSLSSITAAIAVPLFIAFPLLPSPPASLATAVTIAVLITFRHQENIKRLFDGTEAKIGAGSVNRES
jgi:glycerol-3-phosphate acyltransferase PlsY